MNEAIFLLQFNYPRLFSSLAASVFLQGPIFEPNFFTNRSSRAQRASSSTVNKNFCTQKDGRWAPRSETESSHVSDWNYCICLGTEVFPPPHFFARAVFCSTVFISTMFLSTSDSNHHQQNDGINVNTDSGFRLWLLHKCKVRCLNRRRKSSS